MVAPWEIYEWLTFGGVIRNEKGTILFYYLCPAGVSSNNKAELLSLNMGLWEASWFGNQWLLIQGDSCVILRASQASTPLWFLADIIEKVIQISKDLDVSFHHILLSAYSQANCRTKEGVLKPSFFFFILIVDMFFSFRAEARLLGASPLPYVRLTGLAFLLGPFDSTYISYTVHLFAF